MGKQILMDHAWSDEEKEWINSRGRGYLIPENERRFGTADSEASPDQDENGQQVSAFYDDEQRQNAHYDVGGAPLPGTTLNHDTGRVYDRENGVEVQFTGPGHTPGAYDISGRREPEGFSSFAVDDQGNPIPEDNIDEDIVEKVTSAENKGVLVKQLNSLNKKGYGEAPKGDDSREELENKLAIALQDQRDEEKGK